MKKLLVYVLLALVFTGLGLILGKTDIGEQVQQGAATSFNSARSSVVNKAIESGKIDTRMALLLENPRLAKRLYEGGSFGGEMSISAAQNMFGRVPEAIEDVKSKTTITPYGDRAWLIRMPIVNAVLFETDAGLVLVDTGMAPAGPAILDAIRSVSDKPLHTIIYTHGHVDHAYGTWALLEAGETPQIVAHENIMPRFERYVMLPGSLAGYMSQKQQQFPRSLDDLALPNNLFEYRLELEIGGETFVLQHHKGETDDQLYVWLPQRKILATADYYQGFMPNAGNGKRVQRYVKEWIDALREMSALDAQIVLPAHGEAMTNPVTIKRELNLLADAFETIRDQTIDGLNQGLRKDQIVESIRMPEELAAEHTLREQYVSYKDVSKMILKRYTGWWDDLPSQWSPAAVEAQSQMVVNLAGGVDVLVAKTRDMLTQDVQMACHMVDWLWLGAPENAEVQQLLIDVYSARILDPASNTQEILAYLDVMAGARSLQMQAQ